MQKDGANSESFGVVIRIGAISLIDLSECRDLSPISVEPKEACSIGLSRCFADLGFPAAAT